MKKLLFIIILLFSTSAFSINGEAQWEKDVTTHGKALTSQEWTKKVTEPKNCRYGAMETKLHVIGNLSVGFMRSHPDNWLNGKYLEYVNSVCDMNLIIYRMNKNQFDKFIDDTIAEQKKSSVDTSRRESFLFGNILLVLALFYLIRQYLWGKKEN